MHHSIQSTRSSEPYDKDVADELWEQASGGKNFIQINQVCETIDDGINILQNKLEEINSTLPTYLDEIRDLERAKQSANNSSAVSQLEKIQNDIDNLEQDRAEF